MVRKTLEGGWLRVVRVNEGYLWYQPTKMEELEYEREVQVRQLPRSNESVSFRQLVQWTKE